MFSLRRALCRIFVIISEKSLHREKIHKKESKRLVIVNDVCVCEILRWPWVCDFFSSETISCVYTVCVCVHAKYTNDKPKCANLYAFLACVCWHLPSECVCVCVCFVLLFAACMHMGARMKWLYIIVSPPITIHSHTWFWRAKWTSG